MRTMPTIIHADPCSGGGDGIELPTISWDEFHRRLAELAGRPLTAEEPAQAERLARPADGYERVIPRARRGLARWWYAPPWWSAPYNGRICSRERRWPDWKPR